MIPHTDLSTGKIYGCESGSFEYLHEQGHLIFNDKKTSLLFYKNFAFDIWILFVSIALFINWVIPFAFLLGLTIFFISFYEEVWCQRYARLNFRTKDKLNRKNHTTPYKSLK